jgi:hypothetical protein
MLFLVVVAFLVAAILQRGAMLPDAGRREKVGMNIPHAAGNTLAFGPDDSHEELPRKA